MGTAGCCFCTLKATHQMPQLGKTPELLSEDLTEFPRGHLPAELFLVVCSLEPRQPLPCPIPHLPLMSPPPGSVVCHAPTRRHPPSTVSACVSPHPHPLQSDLVTPALPLTPTHPEVLSSTVTAPNSCSDLLTNDTVPLITVLAQHVLVCFVNTFPHLLCHPRGLRAHVSWIQQCLNSSYP